MASPIRVYPDADRVEEALVAAASGSGGFADGSAFLTFSALVDVLANPLNGHGSTADMALGPLSLPEEATAAAVNTNGQSTPAPQSFPVLCDVAPRCANSLAGTLFNVTWGSRVPVLAEPLLRGTSWTSRGGADVSQGKNVRSDPGCPTASA